MENNTIQITPTIIGVVVPSDAYNFEIRESFLAPNELSDVLYRRSNIDTNCLLSGIPPIEFGKYKIHGTSTLPELEFDFEVDESWVEKKWLDKTESYVYLDYTSINKNQYFIMSTDFDNKEKSFRTRIQKAIYDAGLLLINPIDIKGQTFSNEHQNKWQESESKVIRGKLLIIEKI